MHHNVSDQTKRRLSLHLTAYPAHRNARRRQFQENTVLGSLLLVAILVGIALIFATA